VSQLPSQASEPVASTQSPMAPVAAVRWGGDAPVIIDQRLLPGQLVRWRLSTVDAVVEAIRSLAVRGAPAIGITGAYGVVTGLLAAGDVSRRTALKTLARLETTIGTARPTAVNLAAAVARVRAAGEATTGDAADIAATALAEARAIHAQDANACAEMGQHGRAELIGARRILTHCNTGRLATGGDGTALGVIYAKHAAGELDEVIACEARPLLQGGRLTAWELGQAGVPYRLIVDDAAGAAMAAGMVDAVVVGCDRVAADGDTANKIGTYALAVLARHHGLPFYVAGPLTTFDTGTTDGGHIVIEERAASEVRGIGAALMAPADARVWNPAFDVTPAALISGFITERGVLQAPYPQAIARAVAQKQEVIGV